MVRSAHRTTGVVALCAGAAAAAAQPITAYWLNPFSGSWTDGTNWSPAPPNNGGGTQTYEAVINAVGAAYTVDLSAIIDINKLTIDSADATLRLAGLLTLRQDSLIHAGSLHIDGGYLKGAGGLVSHGSVRWSGGGFESGGEIRIAQTAPLLIDGAAGKTLAGRDVINEGQSLWTHGPLWFSHASLVNNGSFVADASVGLLSAIGVNFIDNDFTNSGQFTKIGAHDAEFTGASSQMRFNNHGVVDVTLGSLALLAGGDHTGEFHIAAGASLRVSGNHTLSADALLGGAGSLSVVGGSFDHSGSMTIGGSATFSGGVSTFHGGPVTIGGAAAFLGGATNFHAPASFGSLLVNGGAVALHGAETQLPSGATLSSGSLGGSATQVIGSSFQWNGGSLADQGTTRVETGASMTLGGQTQKFLERQLENNGELRIAGGQLRLDGGELVNNGLLRLESSTNQAEFISIAPVTPGGAGDLINNGTMVSRRGNIDIAAANFYNHGVLDLNNINTIVQITEIYSNFIHTGEITNRSGLELHGSSVFVPGAKITGTGSLFISGGVHDFTPGVYAGTGTLVIGGGSVTLREQPTGSLQINGGTVNFEYIPNLGTTFNRPAQVNFNAGYNAPAGAALVITSQTGAGSVHFGPSDLEFSTGSIFGGLGGSGEITFTGPVEWRGGAMTGPGSTALTATAPLTLSESAKTLSRELEAEADIQWTGGDLTLDGGVFLSKATLTSTGDVSMRAAGLGGQFINDGGIAINSGDMGLLATTQNNGAITIASGATLRIGGLFTQGSGGSIVGAGTVDFVGGSHTIDGGLLSTTGPVKVSGGKVTIDAAIDTAAWSFLGGVANFNPDTAFGTLTLEGGSIGGPGRLAIDHLQWDRGALLDGGEAEITAGGVMTFGADAAADRTLSRSLVHRGVASLEFGAVTIDGGALHNEGHIVLSGGAAIRTQGAGGSLENSGLIDVIGVGVAAIEGAALTFSNPGEVHIVAGSTLKLNTNVTPGDLGSITGLGRLRFAGGSVAVQSGELGVAAIEVAGGAITFDVTPEAAYTFTGGAATFRELFTGSAAQTISAATVRMEGGFALPAGANLTITNNGALELIGHDSETDVLRLQSGALRGDGDLRVNDLMIWNSGFMSGPGRTIVGEGATANIVGLTPVTLSRELLIEGQATISNAFFRLNGGTIRNEGVLAAQTGGAIIGLGAGGVIVNNGLLRAENAGQFRIQNVGAVVEFQNYGRVELFEGSSLLLAGTETLTNEGEIDIARSAEVLIEGDFINASSAELAFTVGGAKDRGLSGLMTITGDAALSGALVISTPESFVGAWGDRWTVLAFASISAHFDTFDLPDTTDEMLRWYAEADGVSYDVGVSHIADIDHDGLIGFADLNVIASNFNAFGTWAQGDVDGDGFVGFADLNVVLSLFNTAAPRNVPGPAAGVALALLAGAGRRRRG